MTGFTHKRPLDESPQTTLTGTISQGTDRTAMPHSPALPVVLLVYRDGLGAIFDSAYFGPVRRLPKYGVHPHIVTMAPVGEWLRPRLRRRWRERYATINAVSPGCVTRLPVPPKRIPGAWNEGRLLARWLRRQYAGDGPVIVHAGGTQAVYLAVQARNHFPKLKIVFQCWGPTAAEFRYGCLGHESCSAPSDIAEQSAIYEEQDQDGFVESDAIVSIGAAMTRYLKAHYLVPSEKIVQVPCCVDVARFGDSRIQRDSVRNRLGIADRFIVVFVGSLHRWQETGSVLRVFKLIQEQQPRAHLLALTPDPIQLTQQLREHGVTEDEATVKHVLHDDVPNHLHASDIALLGRGLFQRPSLVNAISCPIKYGEYLASGCPVILSEGVGDLSHITEAEKVGVVIPHGVDDNGVRSLLKTFLTAYTHSQSDVRERCHRIASQRFDASVYDPSLVQMYRSLATT